MSLTPDMDQQQSTASSVFRFSLVSSVIAVLAASFIGWAISLLASATDIKLAAALTASLTTTLLLLCHANVGGSRSATVIKATAWATLAVTEIIIAALTLWSESVNAFILTGGFSALIFISVAYGVARSGQ